VEPDARATHQRTEPSPAQGSIAPPGDHFHRQVVDNLYDGVYYVDRRRRISYWNTGAERLTGYAASEIVGRRCYSNLLSHVDERGTCLCRGLCPLAATIRDGERREADVFLRHKDGHRVPVRVRVAPVRDASGAIIGAVEIFNDGTDLVLARREADEFRGLAMHDQLSGLANRRQADEQLAAKARLVAAGGAQFGVMIVDIDKFKNVNDTYGHTAGDVVLRNVAQTLAAASRHGDLFARWGGEEFLGIIDKVDDKSLRAAAERLRILCARTRSLVDGQEVDVTVSIGAACVGGNEPLDEALARADAALCDAKSRGRNRSVLSRSTGDGSWSMSDAPPISLQISKLTVDGAEMALVGGSLISGPGLTERAHWTVIAMVPGSTPPGTRSRASRWPQNGARSAVTPCWPRRRSSMAARFARASPRSRRAFSNRSTRPPKRATRSTKSRPRPPQAPRPPRPPQAPRPPVPTSPTRLPDADAAQLRSPSQLTSPSQLRSPHCVVAACQAKPAP